MWIHMWIKGHKRPTCTHDGVGFDVYNVFPSGSQRVHQLFPQDVLNSTLILFHIVWPQSNFHVYELYKGAN
jgi:hypothetical protein